LIAALDKAAYLQGKLAKYKDLGFSPDRLHAHLNQQEAKLKATLDKAAYLQSELLK